MGSNYNEIGGGTTRYQLNLTYLVDTSGSMSGERINQLNVAMAEAVQIAEEAAMEMETDLFMRVVQFSNSAKWLYGDRQRGESHIDWVPLTASGGTDTAGAIDKAREIMHREILGVRNFRPVVILITDGESNEPDKTVAAIAELKASLTSSSNPNKDKITRIAIGVKGANRQELEAFASIGTIQHEDGTVEENVPLVFPVDDIALLKGLVKGVTVSSIQSAVAGGVEGEKEERPVIKTIVEDEEDDWAA